MFNAAPSASAYVNMYAVRPFEAKMRGRERGKRYGISAECDLVCIYGVSSRYLHCASQ